MKIINFDNGQEGEEWHKWRSRGITATDISIILGSNPYKTPYQLWEQKCGYKEADAVNPAMIHGSRYEDIARQWVNEHFGFHLKPICVEDEEEEIFRASLDGYDFDHKVLVEIKCPVSQKVMSGIKINRAFPNYWIDQIMWQIMITKPQKAFLAVWDAAAEMCILTEFFANNECIKRMRREGSEFWRKLKSGIPPELTSKDKPEIENEELIPLFDEYSDLEIKIKDMSKRKSELKEQIIEIGGKQPFKAYGYQCIMMEPRTSYDMKAMEEDGVDIWKYKKVSKSGPSFTLRKENE